MSDNASKSNMGTDTVRILNVILLLVTTILFLIFNKGEGYSENFQFVLLLVIFIFLGFPHGSMDHIIHNSLQTSNDNTDQPKKFINYYYVRMLICMLGWIFFPLLSFIVFILISSYHFGESQLYSYFKKRSPLKKIIYTFWGVHILFSLMVLNLKETHLGIYALFPEFNEDHYLFQFINENSLEIIGILTILNFLGLVYMIISGNIKIKDFCIEVLIVTILLTIFYNLQMIIGFVFYFGIWHSVKAIQQILIFYKKSNISFSIKDFYSKTFVHTIISIFCVFLILLADWYFSFLGNNTLLFFILISILTTPHFFLFNKMANNIIKFEE